MNRLLATLTLCILTVSLNAQGVFGKWKTVDDQTGEQKSVFEIYEKDGKVFGKIVKIMNPDEQEALCEKCEGEDYNKPILGLDLIKNLKKDGKYYKGGTVFDPEKGKEYKCRLYVDPAEPNKLQVRGYLAFFYATQYWIRVE